MGSGTGTRTTAHEIKYVDCTGRGNEESPLHGYMVREFTCYAPAYNAYSLDCFLVLEILVTEIVGVQTVGRFLLDHALLLLEWRVRGPRPRVLLKHLLPETLGDSVFCKELAMVTAGYLETNWKTGWRGKEWDMLKAVTNEECMSCIGGARRQLDELDVEEGEEELAEEEGELTFCHLPQM
ncbi:hypothetical protein NDU88_006451 [Pleurodeles waltl]|uniref:Uncharacterized protein n=1 Tax=Pleurodeles waltl TaxID=8319 RepID=A0AAV7SPT2_PLEWA|nr:hypothetical protein NDU88_006451 [Pleurodeles waltl]